MDQIYQIFRSIYNLPEILVQKWFKTNLISLNILNKTISFTPYLSELEKAVSLLDNDDDAWQGYESLDKETKTTFVLNRFLYVIYKNDDNNLYASEMGDQVYDNRKEFDKLKNDIKNRLSSQEREFQFFSSEITSNLSNINRLYSQILDKLKQPTPLTFLSPDQIVTNVEQLLAFTEINIQILGTLRTTDRQIGELDVKLGGIKKRMENLKVTLERMDTLENSSREIDLVGSMRTKNVDYFSVILEEEDDDISFIVPYAIMMDSSVEMWELISSRIKFEKLSDEDLYYLVNLELTGIDFLSKVDDKYLFEYLTDENLRRLETTNTNLITLKHDIVSSLDCNNTMDPFTNEDFSDMSLADLIHIVKVNGNCYVYRGLMTWLERTDKDPMTNEPFTKEQMEGIKNYPNK